ncbi:glycosyltransferase [Lysinibacillus endophyticus]|uniref:glycosyltransferase n=1 Tax=Ureibacillus endophyticus TaxID=1978490 RepID=UPI003136D04B
MLIVYTKMVTGGSTTSLLSILNNMDYSLYKVDLLLMRHGGDLFESIPQQVNILPPAIPNVVTHVIRRTLSINSSFNYLKSKFLAIKYKNSLVGIQITANERAKYSKKNHKEYDTAISFLELWPTYYVANFIKAKIKISWIHVDYKSVGFNPKIDYKSFKKFDKIVLVSEKCMLNFNENFPDFKNKTIYIENILSSKIIKDLSNEIVEDFPLKSENDKFVISTVCRIDNKSKALDRAVSIFLKLYNEGYCNDLIWYIIGDGPDFKEIKKMIEDNNLEDHIKLLGNKKNPYKYIKESDLFFLPSRYEGKPMAVTEAMILGIPPVVAEYNSAHEQINNWVDGFIFSNSEEAIFEGLKKLLQERELIHDVKLNLHLKDYSNLEEMEKIYNIIS